MILNTDQQSMETGFSGDCDNFTKMECVDEIIINCCSTPSRTNGNIFNSLWSSRGHINSIIRLMGDWLNEQAIKKPLVTQLTCHCKPMLSDMRTHAFTHTYRTIESHLVFTYTKIHTAGECWMFKALTSRNWKRWFWWLLLVVSKRHIASLIINNETLGN